MRIVEIEQKENHVNFKLGDLVCSVLFENIESEHIRGQLETAFGVKLEEYEETYRVKEA